MPKFAVELRQWAEEFAYYEIEADTAEEAAVAVYKLDLDGEIDFDWQDGSDVDRDGVISVKDADGKQVLDDIAVDDAVMKAGL